MNDFLLRFTEPIQDVPALLSSAIYLGLLILSAAQGLGNPFFRRFFVLSLSLFIWNAGMLFGGPDLDRRGSYALVNGGALLFCFALIDFSHWFLGYRRRPFRAIQSAVGLICLAGAAGIVILHSGAVIVWAESANRSLFDTGVNTLILCTLGYCAALLFFTMASTSSSQFRNRLNFIAAAVAVGFVWAGVNLIAKLAGHPEFPASRIGMVMATLIGAYGILRRQAVDFELAVRRTLAVMIYAGLCLAGTAFLARHFETFNAEILFLAGIVFGLAVWALPTAILDRLTRLLQRALYPERFGPQQALIEFSARAPGVTNRKALLDRLDATVARIAPFRRMRYAFRTSGGAWALIHPRGRRPATPVGQTRDLIERLGARSGSLHIEDLERSADGFMSLPADRSAYRQLAAACRRRHVDLAVCSEEPRGPAILMMLMYRNAGQRVSRLQLQALEALAAEAVSDLHRIELLEAARRAERMAAIGEMSSAIAHEIKNPLSAIRGAAQALQNADAGSRDELRQIIAEETKRLDGLVNEFLDFAREAPLEKEPSDLNAVVEKTARLFRLRDDFAGIAVDLDLDPALPPLPADEERIHQLLLNLLGNAVESLNGAGRIVVATQSQSDGAFISVEDNGPGVPESARDKLFEPFFTTKTRGAGLGLAICRKIADAHGGTIEHRPVTPPGHGSIFRLWLPNGSPCGESGGGSGDSGPAN